MAVTGFNLLSRTKALISKLDRSAEKLSMGGVMV